MSPSHSRCASCWGVGWRCCAGPKTERVEGREEGRGSKRRVIASDIPQATGLHIAATWRPARIVGGDYFDILKVDDDVLAICIGDVCGKGMPAAMVMASLQAAVKVYA